LRSFNVTNNGPLLQQISGNRAHIFCPGGARSDGAQSSDTRSDSIQSTALGGALDPSKPADPA
jgi:hypothetical protein